MPYKDPEVKRKQDRDYAAAHKNEAAARFAAWAPQNRDKLNANSARYVQRHPSERTRSAWRHHLAKSYNISVEKFDEMIISQDGRCGLCDKPFGPNRALSPTVDHNHLTGQVRELLHYSCNTGIGHLQDDPAICEKAAVYLRKHEVQNGN